MVIFHKDFENESLEIKDFCAIFGIDEETAQKGNVEKVTDEKEILINRSKTKLLLIAEEIKAEIKIEEENGEFRIVISKKRNNKIQ